MSKWFRVMVICLSIVFLIAGCSSDLARGQSTPTGQGRSILRQGQFRIGVDVASRPLSWWDDNHMFHGYAVDVARRLAELITGRPDAVMFVPLIADVEAPLLKRGQMDMVMRNFSLLEIEVPEYERGHPYWTDSARIVVSKSDGVRTLADLQAKTVAYQHVDIWYESVLEDYFDGQAFGQRVGLRRYPTLIEALPDLKAGRIAALSGPSIFLTPVLQANPDLELLPDQVGRHVFLIYSAVGDRELSQAVDQAIATMEQNGELKKLAHKWGADL